MSSKDIIKNLLDKSGIGINGDKSWDIQVYNEKLYNRVLINGSLGVGEAYVDGWWEAEELDEFFNKVLRSGIQKKISLNHVDLRVILLGLLFNLSRLKAFQIGKVHYDIGNDLYKRMLGKSMVYTCGYWKDANTLDEAQEAKLDLVCKKIGLKKGDRVLDIGSGWGSFINFAAERYGARCVGLSVSKEQVDYANANRGNLQVETRLQNYRDIDEKFNHVVSLGMFEHVGSKNYRFFMKKVQSILKDDGLLLLHTIGKDNSTFVGDPWFLKYIFPNSIIPSYKQITNASSEIFVLEDWHNFGADYDTTLMHWWKNFDTHWDEIKDVYGEKFYRMWKFYLLCSAGSFRARENSLWQIVFSKNGVMGGYKSIR